jgi:hypothetical protein
MISATLVEMILTSAAYFQIYDGPADVILGVNIFKQWPG